VALLDPAGRESFVYDKIHLVPFSEYIPGRNWLWFASDLTALVSDFSSGTQYAVGAIPGGRFSVVICYEAIFPDLVRRFAGDGAELLINVSNDGWFGRSSALAQHLAMARVRAVENRRWLLRGTNTGQTVAVDPYGRIVARLEPFTRGVLEAPYAFRSDTTFYTRWGDWVAWLSVGVTLALLLAAGRSQSNVAAGASNKSEG
jgi:apolipoprotein N-acyltransferase